MPASNPYERRRRNPHAHTLQAGYADGGIFPYGPQRSTVEFEDLEAMVGQAAARGRRQAAELAPERERQARYEAWAEGHEVGISDGEAELLRRIEARAADEIRAAYKATREILAVAEDDPRRVTKAELLERLERHQALLGRLWREYGIAFRGPDGEA